jgi:TolB-like protein
MVQERPARVERRLSAILAADVAGYTRLMHSDEEATHAKLAALLASAINPTIAEHGGRIVKNTGDGFLAEFPSAVEAVRAAVNFQARIHELTIGDAEDRRIAFRVGINIGDIIAEPHDIFGNDVNIAARLESIAEPGGICISSSAYDHVRGKVAVEFGDMGEQTLRNIARPVHVYAMVRENAGPVTCARRMRASAPRLSIVVLPFANLSGSAKQDYFADGITESLTTDLSRINGTFVIACNTAFTFKGKAIDVQQLGRELNVRYVLEGSVQRAENQVRVIVQLIDAEARSHLWADRFDKPVAKFDMQDEIVARLGIALDAQLIEAEARRAELSPKPGAVDLIFQGRSWWNRGTTLENMVRAKAYFERALVLDPGNIEALVGTASVDAASGANFMDVDVGARLAAAEAILIKVLSKSPRHASAHMYLAAVQSCTNRAALAIGECEQALALDRNLADAHVIMGLAKLFIGRGPETEAHIKEALRLSPRDSRAYRWMFIIGVAKQVLGADAEAIVWLRRCVEANWSYPVGHFSLAAALVAIGSLEEAQAAARAGLALDPAFTIRRLGSMRVSDDPTFRAAVKRIFHDMRMAGLPKE